MSLLNVLARRSFPFFAALLPLFAPYAAAAAPKAPAAKLTAPAASPFEASGCTAEILIEEGSGRVLSEVNSHIPLPPASMVKIMVAYVTLKKLKEGVVHADDIVTTSAFASRVGGSQVYLREKEQFTLQQLLEAVLVQSANDAAAAIAEHIGGTEDGFVELMNAEAKRLGLQESVFYSAHGLPPAKGQQPDLVSANDMARLSWALLKDFPEALRFTAVNEAGFRNGTFIMRNHNHLLHEFPGCDGIKTGFYDKAGFCVSATAKRNDLRLIAVVMGCKERKKRDQEAARLLSQGFAGYRAVKMIEQGAPVDRTVTVLNGKLREVAPVAQRSAVVVLKIGDEQRVVKNIAPCEGLTAPAAKGQLCGAVTFSLDDQELARVPLMVPQDIMPIGWGGKLLRKVGW